MKLLSKISLPQVGIVIFLGIVSFTVLHSSFQDMRDRYVQYVVETKFERISSDIEITSQQAVNISSIFSQMPVIITAYGLAMDGDINDENSLHSQEARQFLRQNLAPLLKAYKETTNTDLQLHFHLPNTRSLVRLWRDKQIKIDGQWQDISDDLTSFRPTVLDVNKNSEPVKGIELGRGGFAIRGVVPVKTASGQHLGSVEVLYDFEPILAHAAADGLAEVFLFMNANLLPIATTLQDQTINPRTGNFVRVTAPTDPELEQYVTADLLQAGSQNQHYENYKNLTMATIPVQDYRGEQVGVLVCALKTDAWTLLTARADRTLAFTLIAMALIPVIVLFVGLRILVTGPITRIKEKIQDIAEDRADLNEQLPCYRRDEIGDLSRWFNTLTTKLDHIFNDMQRYVNVLNTVPDPIFVVDDDYRMIMANKATLDYLEINEDNLLSCKCYEQFHSVVCETSNCPIAMTKQLGRPTESDIVELTKNGESIFIKASANILYDSQGNQAGYVEVARIVTDLVHSEQNINHQLERIQQVNTSTKEAAQQLSATARILSSQFSEAQTALDNQQERLHETVTAMDQMNATVHQVAQAASEAAEQSQAAHEQAMQGADIVEKSIQAILRVSEQATAMRDSMDTLGQQAHGIGAVLGVISDIADQTNLLALNAAIEAARAGDAGRGFAVVADEVRKLAEKTMQATTEVEQVITSIQKEAQISIQMANETGSLADAASRLATQSGDALSNIVALVTASSDQVRTIATAAEEQSATSEHINRAIEEVATMATDVTTRTDASSQSVTELTDLSGRLNTLSAG